MNENIESHFGQWWAVALWIGMFAVFLAFIPFYQKSQRKPASVGVCALLDKPERRRAEVPIDFRGFVIPDAYVVGYGLDAAGRWRHLPQIHTVQEQD